MEKQIFSIPNISCGHCVMSIKNELSEFEGVTMVDGNPESKKILVEWDSPASLDTIKDKLKEINFPTT